jgi:hypothetical protein
VLDEAYLDRWVETLDVTADLAATRGQAGAG